MSSDGLRIERDTHNAEILLTWFRIAEEYGLELEFLAAILTEVRVTTDLTSTLMDELVQVAVARARCEWDLG
jgi:hypothetical protein